MGADLTVIHAQSARCRWPCRLGPVLVLIVVSHMFPVHAISLDKGEVERASAVVDTIGVIRFSSDCTEETVASRKFCWGTLREEAIETMEAEAREQVSEEVLAALRRRGRTKGIGAIARGVTFAVKKGIPVAGQVVTAWEVGTAVGDLVSENIVAPEQEEYYRKKQVAEDRKAVRVTELLKGDRELAKRYSKMLLSGRREEADELLERRLQTPLPAADSLREAGRERAQKVALGPDTEDEVVAARRECGFTEEYIRELAVTGERVGEGCERLALLMGVELGTAASGGANAKRGLTERDVGERDGTAVSDEEWTQSRLAPSSHAAGAEAVGDEGGPVDGWRDPADGEVADRGRDALLAMVIDDVRGRAVERANIVEGNRRGAWEEAYRSSRALASQVDGSVDDQTLVEQIQRASDRELGLEPGAAAPPPYYSRPTGRGGGASGSNTPAPAPARESSGACEQLAGDEDATGRVTSVQREICSDLFERFSYFDTNGERMANCEIYNQAISIYTSQISADRICVRRIVAAGALGGIELACLRHSSDLNIDGVEASIQRTRVGMTESGCDEEDVVDLFAGQE